MKTFKIALLFSLIGVFSFNAEATTTKVEIKNNKVRVQEQGIYKDYGRVRKVETRNGITKVYTNRKYDGAAVEYNSRNGNISTSGGNGQASYNCTFSCSMDAEDDE